MSTSWSPSAKQERDDAVDPEPARRRRRPALRRTPTIAESAIDEQHEQPDDPERARSRRASRAPPAARGRPSAPSRARSRSDGHHPGRAPEQRDERDEPDRGERASRCPRSSSRRPAWPSSVTGRHVDELVDHALAQLVVLEHEAEDRDEDDRQREEREEDVERDRRGVLRAAVAEEVLDRARQRVRDARCAMSSGPRSERVEPAARRGSTADRSRLIAF